MEILGDTPNEAGPNELRGVEATKRGSEWRLRVIPDHLSEEDKKRIGKQAEGQVDGSVLLAQKTHRRLIREKKDLVFYVHGYNNDVEDVLNGAAAIEERYNVVVLPFTWPANGGGARGLASYLSDKRDARASHGALSRVLEKAQNYLRHFRGRILTEIQEKAEKAHGHRSKAGSNAQARDEFISKKMHDECPYTVNALFHSMGNYLYKHVLTFSDDTAGGLLFDNVILCAADANNENHAYWVDQIQCRKSVYVTINEDDYALAASRAKAGSEQRARLGHYRHRLDSRQAKYVDFTDAPFVKRSHSYFSGSALRNKKVEKFFRDAFTGERAEKPLRFDDATRMYRVR